MPVEYWNPIPIYYDDVSEEEFEKIKKEIYDNVSDDMYGETEWKDLVQTTMKFSRNIIKELCLINLQTLILKHTLIYFSKIKIKNNYYIIDSWCNILPKYGHQLLHTHSIDSNIYTGVYFYENSIEKMEPLRFVLKNEIRAEDVFYEYTPGRILIFSGKLSHCVHFNQSDEPRKTFTFNIQLV